MTIDVTQQEYEAALARDPSLRLRQKFDVIMELQRWKNESALEQAVDDRERLVIEDILG